MKEETKVSLIYTILAFLTGFSTVRLSNTEVAALMLVFLAVPKYIIEQVNTRKDPKYETKEKMWWLGNAFLPYIVIVFALWTILLNI